jgi:hypothetical protein
MTTNNKFRVTFRTYSAILKKTFTQVRDFQTMADFSLHAKALYSGNYEVVSVEHI